MAYGSLNINDETSTYISILPTSPSIGRYHINNGDSTFPYPYGYLEINYGCSETEMVATYYSTGQDNNIYYNTYLNATWYTGWTGWKRVTPRIITFSPTVTLSSDYGIAQIDISDKMNSNIEGIICVSPIYHFEQTQYNFQYGILDRTKFNIICREAKGLTFSPNIMVILGSY